MPVHKVRIVQTVSSIESEASGLSYVVPKLCKALAALDHEVDLLSLGPPCCAEDGTYRDRRFAGDFDRLGPLRKLGASGAQRRALMASNGDVFHTHGLWMMPNVYPAQAARARAAPLMLSPHGMLGKKALQFSWAKKRAFWALLQGRAARQVQCFHATADQEYEDIRAFGMRQPVAVIPNGIDPPSAPALPSRTGVHAPFVLSLGRIHPVKALDRLIRAWALVVPEFPHWRLKIVGPSELGHADELERLARSLQLSSVDISGPVYGTEKTALLAGAELFALPTLNENFAMTVAESLAAGTPVISTKGAPWAGLETECCGWWIEHGVEPLAAALRTALALPDEERRAMGARGRAWMARDFAWDGIARQMAGVYRWLVQGGEPPACVRTE
jgi:glycosyltransferase involved in cell wall biosynthesis